MFAVLRVLSFVPFVVAVKLRREERRLVEWFRARGALDEQRAVTLTAERAIERFVQRRLEGAGAIRIARERYYFDESSYAGFRARRKKRAMMVATVLIIGLIVAFATGVMTL